MNTHSVNRYTQFITPLSGIIALVFFFMPWISSGDTLRGYSHTRLGFQFFVPNFAPRATLIIIVFMASIVIVSLSLYTIIRRTPWKSKTSILISSGIGLTILLAEQMTYARITETVAQSNYAMEFGFWGTVIGLAVAAIGVLFVRSAEENGRSTVSVETKRLWFVVHGGIVALFCFFMPWSGFTDLTGWSGFRLMKLEPVVTAAFIASIITVVGSFYTLTSEDFKRLRVVVLVSIGIGLGILLSYCVNFYVQNIHEQNILRNAGTEISKRSLKLGLWGTVLGYIIAAVGMFLIQRKNTNKQVETPAVQV